MWIFFPKSADRFLFYLICNVAATCTKKLSKCMYKYICIHVLYCVFHLLSEIIKNQIFRLPIILTSAIWTVYGCPWKIGALSFTSPIWMFTVSFTTWGGGNTFVKLFTKPPPHISCQRSSVSANVHWPRLRREEKRTSVIDHPRGRVGWMSVSFSN